MIIRVYIGVMSSVIIFMYVFILLSSWTTWRKNKRSQRVRSKYEKILFGCLEPGADFESVHFPGTDNYFNCEILLDLFKDLAATLQGVEKKILLLVYRNSGLEDYIMKVFQGNDSKHKIHALSVYCDLEAGDNSPITLGHHIYSDNQEVRMFVLLGRLNLMPGSIMSVLKDYTYTLNQRSCANIHSLIMDRSIPLWDTDQLLESANPSVVNFGRRLMEICEIDIHNDIKVVMEYDAYV